LIACLATPHVHQRLVVVRDRAEWARAILFQYHASLGEPLNRFVASGGPSSVLPSDRTGLRMRA
jgi:hypothetical protein